MSFHNSIFQLNFRFLNIPELILFLFYYIGVTFQNFLFTFYLCLYYHYYVTVCLSFNIILLRSSFMLYYFDNILYFNQVSIIDVFFSLLTYYYHIKGIYFSEFIHYFIFSKIFLTLNISLYNQLQNFFIHSRFPCLQIFF